MSMTHTTDSHKIGDRLGPWVPDMQALPCTDERCSGESHEVDVADPEDEAFHTAFALHAEAYSVRVTRFESDIWRLDVETEPGIKASDALMLAASTNAAAHYADALNNNTADAAEWAALAEGIKAKGGA